MLLMILINYLTSSPFPAQDLHLCGAELVVACKFQLYDQQGLCPSCGKASDILLGEHSLVCGMGGECVVELLRCHKKRLLKRRLLQAPFKAPIHSECYIGGFRGTGLTLVIVLRCD